MGVGNGTFAVFICMIMSVLCCFFRHLFVFPNACVFLAVIFPLFVFLLIYIMPKESLKSDVTQEDQLPTSWYFLKTMTFSILIFLVFLLSLCAFCAMKIKRISVRRHDSEVGADMVSMGSLNNKKGYTSLNASKNSESNKENSRQNANANANAPASAREANNNNQQQ